jgi:TetR/AcrR family transcriptional regulator
MTPAAAADAPDDATPTQAVEPPPAQADGADAAAAEPAAAAGARKRSRPGERRVQILQTLASMLEQPDAEKITTAALAARLDVSEAALYRHFASKAQMYEGLIEFIESSVFALINQIQQRDDANGLRQAQMIVAVLLGFAERNRGMTRVMTGDALVYEHERLQARINLFFDKVEAALRQSLRHAHEQGLYGETPVCDPAVRAGVLLSFTLGRLHRYAKGGFKRAPTEQMDPSLRVLLA